ncbi:cotton fiber protein [Tasmannia lanceolata]|uniref:cotton fiber protein n=1 Tax=Tasmannia lanceolata TaxID=3420 RepID=UPI00406336EA
MEKEGSTKKTLAGKKRSGMSLLRAALLMVRRQPHKPTSVHADVVESAGKGLKNLVGAVRPLHLQHQSSSPTSEIISAGITPAGSMRVDSFHDVFRPPPSPSCCSDVDDGMSSRYASAEDLRELDNSGKSDDNGGYGNGGDEAIDVRAEEFIAKFYEQMRLQRMDSMNRYN